MCATTNSFRSVYQSSRKLRFIPSFKQCFESGRLGTLPGTHKCNRRYENDAIRKFIASISVDTETVGAQQYTCSQFEVEMTTTDYKQIGLDPVLNSGARRQTSVVIDAKVFPLLKERECEGDHHDVLYATRGL